MNGVQCYELFGGIALKNQAFIVYILFKITIIIIIVTMINYTKIALPYAS